MWCKWQKLKWWVWHTICKCTKHNIEWHNYKPNNPNNRFPNKGAMAGNEVFTEQGGYSNGGHGNNCANTESQWT
jgi:hypothetical protein